MRTALKPYVNQYVLCKGWIADWEQIPEKGIKRVYVSNPTIKKPDKTKLFKEQECISKEHHLNLFIKEEDLKFYDTEFGMHLPISFTGNIYEYTRKNGTTDFGVYPTKQSTLHYQLDWICDMSLEVVEHHSTISMETLVWFERVVKPKVANLTELLENAGDELPTFKSTYQNYKKELMLWNTAADKASNIIRSICSNRSFRRKHKVARNFAKHLPRM